MAYDHNLGRLRFLFTATWMEKCNKFRVKEGMLIFFSKLEQRFFKNDFMLGCNCFDQWIKYRYYKRHPVAKLSP